jgi:hypothetical protein
MVPNFTFEVEPVVVRKKHAKRNDLSGHYLAHSIEITAALRKIGDARCVSCFSPMPNCIEMHA